MDLKELEEKIKAALAQVEHPQHRKNLMELGLYGRIEESEGNLKLFLKTPDSDRKMQIDLESLVRAKLKDVSIPGKLKIRFELDAKLKPEDDGNRLKGVKKVMAIGSGKGGVGKSTVAANLAIAMAQKNLKVGLLDTDIYGPSLGKLFGHEGRVSLKGDGENKIFPIETSGIKLMSFSFLLDQDQAVVWRGPMLGKAVEQFLFDVIWGELDCLLIDLPPGTGDVQLSLAQLVDIDGAIIVTTPQNVALQDASRAASMFKQVKIPVLGVIENMSAFVCPSCGTTSHIFSQAGGQAFSEKLGIPQLGQIPLQKDIMESGEDGSPIVFKDAKGPLAKIYGEIADQVLANVEE